MKGQTAILACVIFVTWSLGLVQAEPRRVVAVVVKNPNFPGAPVLKLNAHDILSVPRNQASIEQTTPLVANAVNQVDTPNYVDNDAAPVPVIEEKPKKVIRYKLIKMSDEDIQKEKEAKRVKQLKDAEDARIKKVLYPCRDYSPICGRYKNIWNPAVAQCRDVWMQRNCRETCGLCKIPVGVYLACNDMQHCKKLGTHSCVHDWVKQTCKTMCGSCDGSKGGKNARVGASSVFVGKKKSLVETKKVKKDDVKIAVKTVHQAVKLQGKPLEAERHISKEKDDSEEADNNDDDDDDDDDEQDDTLAGASGDNQDDEEKDDESEDTELEKQPSNSDMENQSGDHENAKDDKPEPEPEAQTKPVKHASVPKVTIKTTQKIVVQKPAAPKIHHHDHRHHHHHKQKNTKTPKKVQAVKNVNNKTLKKSKNLVKALVLKHKKPAKKVVNDKKPAAIKVKTVKIVEDKPPKKKQT